MQICRTIVLALAMGCLAAGSPVPNETPSARNDQIAREELASAVHHLEADEAIPADEVASDISTQAEVFADGSSLSRKQDEEESSVRQFGITIPELKLTQFQRYDDGGRYSFGYAYPGQVRMESRNEDGVVTGSYFYNDPNGTPNQVQYLADGSGFHVAANNLPVFVPGHQPQPVQDTPEVMEAKRKHLEAWAAIAQQNKAQVTDKKEPTIQKVEIDESRDAVITDALEADEIKAAIEQSLPFTSTKIEQEAVEIKPANKQPSIKPLDPDVIIDDENQAIITEQDADINAGIFEIDAEPIRLLAQLYAKHVEDAQPLQPIERPAGFHPQNLKPSSGFDLFSRLEGDDRQAIEVTNPEFVDLRAFLLTNRIRANQVPQIIQSDQTQEKPSKFDDNSDLFISEDPADLAFDDGEIVDTNDLYNYYFNIANGGEKRPIFAVNRESLNKLPESLQLALTGMAAIDGHHNVQSMPSQQIRQKQQLLNQQRFATNYLNQQQLRYYSPYSPVYSPYNFYRQNVHMSPYNYHVNPYSSYYRNPSATPYSPFPYTNYNPYYSY